MPSAAATEQGWFRRLWANEKARHGLIAGAGILVVCAGVVLALLVGANSKPAAETVGEGLAHAADSYETVSDDRSPRSPATTPQATIPPATVEAPVGDVATTTTPSKSGSSSGTDPDSDTDPPKGLPPSQPPTCPSTDSRCGPFHWEPAPAENKPLVVDPSLTADGVAVNFDGARAAFVVPVGAQVVFRLTAHDPDAAIIEGPCSLSVDEWVAGTGDGDGCVRPDVLHIRPYGANRPPDPVAGDLYHDWEPTLGPGTYAVKYRAESGDLKSCGVPGGGPPELCNPYGSTAEGVVTIIVE